MWDYNHVVVAHGNGSITCISINGSSHLSTVNHFLNRVFHAEWNGKADLCSLVKHHLCWHGWRDLCWAGRIEQTCMKHNTPLMDICRGSLTSKCQHGYRLPLFPPPPFPVLGERRCRVTVRKPRQLWCMHASFMDWQQHTHTENDCRKTVTL